MMTETSTETSWGPTYDMSRFDVFPVYGGFLNGTPRWMVF